MCHLGLPLLQKIINIWFHLWKASLHHIMWRTHWWFLNGTLICFISYVKKPVHMCWYYHMHLLDKFCSKSKKLSLCLTKHSLGTRWRWVVNFLPWPLYPKGNLHNSENWDTGKEAWKWLKDSWWKLLYKIDSYYNSLN